MYVYIPSVRTRYTQQRTGNKIIICIKRKGFMSDPAPILGSNDKVLRKGSVLCNSRNRIIFMKKNLH